MKQRIRVKKRVAYKKNLVMLCTRGDYGWFKFGKHENSAFFYFRGERKGCPLINTCCQHWKNNEYVLLHRDINSPKNGTRTKSKGPYISHLFHLGRLQCVALGGCLAGSHRFGCHRGGEPVACRVSEIPQQTVSALGERVWSSSAVQRS